MVMNSDDIITWLKDNNCTVEFKNDGNVKVSLKQNERDWYIERDSLQDAVESIIYSECII